MWRNRARISISIGLGLLILGAVAGIWGSGHFADQPESTVSAEGANRLHEMAAYFEVEPETPDDWDWKFVTGCMMGKNITNHPTELAVVHPHKVPPVAPWESTDGSHTQDVEEDIHVIGPGQTVLVCDGFVTIPE